MKRTLSLIISFVMMVTMVSLPTGVFAEESIADGNEAIVTDTVADNAAEQDTVEQENIDGSEAAGAMEETDAEIPVSEEPITEEVAEPDAESEEESAAESDAAEKVVSIDPIFAGEVNPLYDSIISESEIPQVSVAKQSSASARNVEFQDKATVVASLRDAMEARQATITLYYKTTSYDGTDQIFYDLFDAAMVHTKVPTEGDYLQWQWGTWGAGLTGEGTNGEYNLTLTYEVEYYTTAAQEAEVTAEVNDLKEQLGLTSTTMSAYDKTVAIYDYICENVDYDHTSTGTLKHSAYAAFIKGDAVCQGYALMFYRLALEAGLDARIVAGYGGDPSGSMEAHGWNIVKIGKLYYNLDATWDEWESTTPPAAGYTWFLRYAGAVKSGDSYSFDKWHVPDPKFNTNLDLSKYPRSTADYEVKNGKLVISNMTPQLSYTRVEYDGTEKEPTVTIPGLTAGTDFTVSYSNNKNIGTAATVTITGNEANGYTGTITRTFQIGKNFNACTATLSYTSTSYNGSAKKPKVTVVAPATESSAAVTLVQGTSSADKDGDYIVSYKNNTNAGTATVTISGINDYVGTITKTFKINPASLTGKTVTLSATTYTYNGTARKPTVTVAGVPSANYSATYSNNIYPGSKATVKITGKNNYTGTITKYFTIKAPVVAAQKTVSVNLYGHDDFIAKWNAQKIAGATVKYKVEYKRYGSKYKWTNLASGTTAASLKKANLADGTRYAFRVTPYVTVNGKNYIGATKTSAYVYSLKKLSKPKVKKSSRTKIKVSWNNISGETGYQIARSTKKSKGYKVVKTVKTTKGKSTTYKTKRNKNYYYKVRAYKVVDGKKIYGPWSSPRKYKLR